MKTKYNGSKYNVVSPFVPLPETNQLATKKKRFIFVAGQPVTTSLRGSSCLVYDNGAIEDASEPME
jgi:hypothetical protein